MAPIAVDGVTLRPSRCKRTSGIALVSNFFSVPTLIIVILSYMLLPLFVAGALGVAAMSTLGWSSPAGAKGLFDVGQNDKVGASLTKASVGSLIHVVYTPMLRWVH